MELIYLWVEDYKNIKKQGFNFSPRFECKYDEGTQELIIDENKEHVSIFPDNINITAIVGENGSGKSRVLECIEKIILADSEEELNEFKYILVYYDEVPLYLSNIKINTSIEKETVFGDICSLVYKYYISGEEIHQAQYYNSANLHYFTLQKQGIVNILSAKQNDMNSFHISSFMYEPIKVEISLKSYDKLIQEHISMINFRKRDEIEEILKATTDLYHQYLSICYIRQKRLDVDFSILKDRALLIENTRTSLSQDDFSKFFISVLATKEYTLFKMSHEQKDIYFHKDYWHCFEFDFIDEKERRYNHLSHGEKVIFSQLLCIFFYINANEKLIFLFDEPEIALHPNWQKKYLNEVISLLRKIPKKYHFIFTTHSPFLLSDLSNQDVIYLKKDEVTGNCINSTKEMGINPFGANIHTLLSHGFFMQDGLMGEFAKEKINEVIQILKRKRVSQKNLDYCEKIISIIGEPILQKTLVHKLNEKLLSKEVKLRKLQKKQEEIKKEIESLINETR